MKRLACGLSVCLVCALAARVGAITISVSPDSSGAGAHLYTYDPATGAKTAVTLLLGLSAEDDVDAVSLGDDPYCDAGADRRDVFCVAAGSTGCSGQLRDQFDLGQPVAGDVYRESHATPINRVVELGGYALNNVTVPPPPIDALDFTDLTTEGPWVYFSLAPNSGSLGNSYPVAGSTGPVMHPITAADILCVQAGIGAPPQIYVYARAGTELPNLSGTDNVDALSVRDKDSDGVFDSANDMLICSVTQGGSVDGGIIWHYGAQAIGQPGPVNYEAHENTQFGVGASDEITALEHHLFEGSGQEGEPEGTVPALSGRGAAALVLILGALAAATTMKRRRANVA